MVGGAFGVGLIKLAQDLTNYAGGVDDSGVWGCWVVRTLWV